jgi:hypothetical protein
MNDQLNPEGGALPSVDASASQVEQSTDVESAKPGSEADSSPAAKDPSDKPKPPKSGEQLRIDELTRRLRESERRYERVLKIAEERGTPPPPPPPALVQQPSQPKGLKDFNYDENAYREHLFTEAANKAAQVAEEKSREILRKQEQASRYATYEAREAAFAKTVEDFDEVTDPGPEHAARWACSQAMADVIYESEEGPALKYYLASNPDVAAKLAKLSPVQAVRELTRVEDRLVSERKSAAQKPVSQAPPPAPQIDAKDAGSSRVSTTSPESDAMKDDEWFRAELARLNRKAKRQAE